MLIRNKDCSLLGRSLGTGPGFKSSKSYWWQQKEHLATTAPVPHRNNLTRQLTFRHSNQKLQSRGKVEDRNKGKQLKINTIAEQEIAFHP